MSVIRPNSNQHASIQDKIFLRALFIKGMHNIVMHLKHDAFSPFWSLESFDLVQKEVVYSTVIDFGVTEA
jgi:hypothetical protein